MRQQSLLAVLLLLVCIVVLLNIASFAPAPMVMMNAATAGPAGAKKHHGGNKKHGGHPDAGEMHDRPGHPVHGHTKQSSLHTKQRADGSPHFAFEHSIQLQAASHHLIQDSGTAFLELFDAFHEGQAPTPHTELDKTCGYVQGSFRLEKLDYSHRVKRRGELSTMDLYKRVEAIASAGGGHGFFAFGTVLPMTLNAAPVQLSSAFDISEPFGSWSTRFLPLNDTYLGHDSTGDLSGHPHSKHHQGSHQGWLAHYRPPQRVEPQPPAYVAMFHNAVISHGHLVTCPGQVLTAGGCLWDFHLPPIASTRAVHAEDVAVALCDEWCKGYYHFTHEHLPRVAVVHRLLLERNASKLVLSHSPNGFQRQFLTDVLGIPKEQIVHGKAVLGRTALYPTPMRCGNTFTTMLYMIRRIVYDRLDLGEGPTIPSGRGVAASPAAPVDGEERSVASTTKLRLLFAERKHLSRMPTNYADLKKRLMAEFEDAVEYDTTTGDSDARSQIERFHRADIVVGPHGANLANMMWMRHGTHVVEIASRRKGNMCYYTTASRINVTHHLVLHNKGKDAAFELEYEYLRRHVAHAIRLILDAAV